MLGRANRTPNLSQEAGWCPWVSRLVIFKAAFVSSSQAGCTVSLCQEDVT